MNYNSLFLIIEFIRPMPFIIFLILTYKFFVHRETKKEGKNKRFIYMNIGYIRVCLDKNFNKLDERYRNAFRRVSGIKERMNLIEGG